MNRVDKEYENIYESYLFNISNMIYCLIYSSLPKNEYKNAINYIRKKFKEYKKNLRNHGVLISEKEFVSDIKKCVRDLRKNEKNEMFNAVLNMIVDTYSKEHIIDNEFINLSIDFLKDHGCINNKEEEYNFLEMINLRVEDFGVNNEGI